MLDEFPAGAKAVKHHQSYIRLYQIDKIKLAHFATKCLFKSDNRVVNLMNHSLSFNTS